MTAQRNNKQLNTPKSFEKAFNKQTNFFPLFSSAKQISKTQLEYCFKQYEFEEMKKSRFGVNCYIFFTISIYTYYLDLSRAKDAILPYVQAAFILLLLAALAAINFSFDNFRVYKFFHEAFAFLVAIYNIFHLVTVNVIFNEKENNSKITASYYFIVMTFFNIFNTFDLSFLRFFWDFVVNLAIFILVTFLRIDSDVRGLEDIIIFIIMISVAFFLKEQNVSEHKKIFFKTYLLSCFR